MSVPRRGVYPGSFDPFTVAHLAIAEAAWRQCHLDDVVVTVSTDPLGKQAARQSPVAERVAAIEAAARDGRPWLKVAVTRASLIVDLASGYDVVIVGADKWAQIGDPRFYPEGTDITAVIGALPPVAVAPRGDQPLPPDATVLQVPTWMQAVSSSAVREGRDDWRAGPATRG